MKIGITCYPSIGGSGILATALGEELARRGHEIHFISYESPFRLTPDLPRVFFHPVTVNDYNLFKYPDYTLPLSVKMAEVGRKHQLDVLHVHYAIPHATAAILARAMLPAEHPMRVITTLHGTDTTLLGYDSAYAPALHHALKNSDAVTAVSNFLKDETRRALQFDGPLEVIYNFSKPRAATRSREEIRAELGLRDEVLLFHASNLRPLKRIDLLLETVARIQPRESFKLLILAGDDFAPFAAEVRRLQLADRIIVREKITSVEDYLPAADLGIFTSDAESFCLGILEGMYFGCPAIARRVGGIPEVIADGVTGKIVDSNNPNVLARAAEELIANPEVRLAFGQASRARAGELFSAETIVPQYENLYQRVSSKRKN
jgi:L-malate glycosyltransferase